MPCENNRLAVSCVNHPLKSLNILNVPSKTVSGFGFAKALIFGEYAVMYGAPGLAVALSPKLTVSLSHIRQDTTTNPLSPASSHDEIVLSHLSPPLTALVTCNDKPFFDPHGNKFGIGSSAARVVALTMAHTTYCRSLHPQSFDQHSINRHALLLNAIRAHRALQNGLGSGIDILASALGGAILAENCPTEPRYLRIPESKLPPFALFTLHRRAPTMPFILAAQKKINDRQMQSLLQQFSELSHSLADCLLHNKKSRFLETMTHYPALLSKWAQVIEMPVLPDAFDELSAIAKNNHIHLKTAGAGGGDLLIAFAAENQADAFEAFTQEANGLCRISRLPFHIAPAHEWFDAL